jgi:tRNA threonylcarbamoyladenosine biosynthesis protein TsaB
VPLFLALDAATDRPSLALGSPDSPGDVLYLASRRGLSRDIEHLVGRLLAERGVALGRLAGLVVADGPGSFTGLRIGAAFAKGLWRASSIAFLTAPSLLGAAYAASRGRGDVIAEYDALRGDVYRAAYRFTAAAPETAAAVEVLSSPALVAATEPPPLQPAAGARSRATASDASAAALLALVAVVGATTTVADPAAWEPWYGRPAEAEARRLARQDGPRGA